MNMPRTEFFCGIPQETSDWRLPYRHKIFVFERHRAFEPKRDLAFLIARWLRKKQRLPEELGYVHQVAFPEQPEMEMLAWTAYQAFQLNEPTDHHPAPGRLVLFTTQVKLLEWKRHYWLEHRLSPEVAFMVHANCLDPDGNRMRTRRLLTFDG